MLELFFFCFINFIKEQKITGPTGFKHNTSIKMDTTGEINLDNLPDEFKQIFKKAGISKKDL